MVAIIKLSIVISFPRAYLSCEHPGIQLKVSNYKKL